MPAGLSIDVVTIFPGMLNGFLEESMLKRAAAMGAVRFQAVNLRNFTVDRHQTVDDRPYGGGPGMIMLAEPLLRAAETLRTPATRVILMSPQGRRFDQAAARELAQAAHLLFLCGHYEGVDERVSEELNAEELSIGDYILTNGTLAATVVIDAVVRLLPGVLGAPGAAADESFSPAGLEYPQYTRPEILRGRRVPAVLLSGDHAAIRAWRQEQSRQRTAARRPDLAPPAGPPATRKKHA